MNKQEIAELVAHLEWLDDIAITGGMEGFETETAQESKQWEDKFRSAYPGGLTVISGTDNIVIIYRDDKGWQGLSMHTKGAKASTSVTLDPSMLDAARQTYQE